MELEVREVQPNMRQKYQTRLKSYKTELSNLERDLVSYSCRCDYVCLKWRYQIN